MEALLVRMAAFHEPPYAPELDDYAERRAVVRTDLPKPVGLPWRDLAVSNSRVPRCCPRHVGSARSGQRGLLLGRDGRLAVLDAARRRRDHRLEFVDLPLGALACLAAAGQTFPHDQLGGGAGVPP